MSVWSYLGKILISEISSGSHGCVCVGEIGLISENLGERKVEFRERGLTVDRVRY